MTEIRWLQHTSGYFEIQPSPVLTVFNVLGMQLADVCQLSLSRSTRPDQPADVGRGWSHRLNTCPLC